MNGNFEMFRLPALGINSSDLLNQQNQSNPNAFYGSMWRFRDDQAHAAKIAAQAQANDPTQASFSSGTSQTGHLVDEAKRLGMQVPQGDGTGQLTDAQKQAQLEADRVTEANRQAIRGGTPPAPPAATTGTPPNPPGAPGADDQGGTPDGVYLISQLRQKSINEVKEIAASIGIANLEQKKEDLVQQVMAKQQANQNATDKQ